MSSRILVIEDEERIAQFLKRGLIYEGYRVDVAYDGQTGLDIARDQPPDLVILDWMLPGLDGLEVCRRLRAASDVLILMLTAKDEVADRVMGLDAGADPSRSTRQPFHRPDRQRVRAARTVHAQPASCPDTRNDLRPRLGLRFRR
jgi:DNA-binding response OmpR family regulator